MLYKLYTFHFRFSISKDDAHASVVVFSDRIPHTYVSIKLVDYFTNIGFKKAVADTPLIGYRTRMDLAFKLADKQIFTTENGM